MRFSAIPLNYKDLSLPPVILSGVKKTAEILEFPKTKRERLKKNTELYERALEAEDNFKQALKAKKTGTISDDEFNDLKNASLELGKQVLAISKLLQITANSGDHLIDPLVKNELVHPADKEEMKKRRLGNKKSNKDCQALIIETENGPLILAQIFRVQMEVPSTKGKAHLKDIPSNVDNVKEMPLQKRTGKENFVGYYTVSKVFTGASAELISRLDQVKPKHVHETTISPIRAFLETQSREELLKLNDNEIKQKALSYLLEKTDLVEKFHLKNGAYIGDININRDAPAGSEDWITVNYIYDREKIETNKEHYDKGKGPLPMAEHLRDLLTPEQISKTLENSSIIDVRSRISRLMPSLKAA